MNHLPQDTEVIFAEINMINYLQKATLDLYNKEMNKHKERIKEREDEDDKRNEEIISKRLAKKIAKE